MNLGRLARSLLAPAAILMGSIGFAQGVIAPGEHVHTHNLAMRDFGRDYAFCADAKPVEYYPAGQMRSFQGFARPNGRVGTRNYLAVISSVNCSASVSHYVRDRFRTAEFKRDFSNVDGVIAFTHKAGCAMGPGEPQRVLQRVSRASRGIRTFPAT